jgi:dTDP-4-amino-4,6-dideoxygalactose transaminase
MSAEPPALLGGPAVRPQGPPDWPGADEAIRDALLGAWRDGSWGVYHGRSIPALYERLTAYHGVADALSCGSGTFAVELALRALRVGAGDEVILADYDYPGNFLTIHALGAIPVLVDVHPSNWNLDVDRLEAAITPSTKAVLVSHLHGGLVPMERVREIADRHGIRIVEDACQCPGAMVQGKRAGTWGDVGVLSFGGSKLLTAGRGGAILTPHADVAQRARLARFRGNLICPLSELQAAVLLPQFERLDERNSLRLGRVQSLDGLLADLPGLKRFRVEVDGSPAFYKVGYQYDAAAFGLSRELFVKALRAEGIAFDEGFRAAHVGRSPSRFRASGSLAEAEKAHHGTVVLHHPVLLGTEADMEEVARAVHKVWTARELLQT